MMNHTARTLETDIVVDHIDAPTNDQKNDIDQVSFIRRHRAVTAIIRRRSSKLAQLVQTVVDKHGAAENDNDDDDDTMSTKIRRAASAPRRMSISSFYADVNDESFKEEPQSVVQQIVQDGNSARRSSIQEQTRRQILRPRTSISRPPAKLVRPPPRPKTSRIKSTLPNRRGSVTASNKPKKNGNGNYDNKSNSDSDSDTDSDSSLSTLESLVELKNRIDEIVGTRPVHASRSVRRGSASHIMSFDHKKKNDEKSKMVADSVMQQRRPSLVGQFMQESKRRSLNTLVMNTNHNHMDKYKYQQTENDAIPKRGRSASVAATSVLNTRPAGRTQNDAGTISSGVTSRHRAGSLPMTTTDLVGARSPAARMVESRRASLAANTSTYRARRNVRRASLFAKSTSSNACTNINNDNIRDSTLLQLPEELNRGRKGSFGERMKRGTTMAGERRRATIPEGVELSVPDQISVKLARERFRRVARLVLNCVKICRRSYLNIEDGRSEFQSFIQVGTRPDDNGDRLFFDPDYFKADRSQRLSDETKRILTEHPENRTDKDLKYVQIALRNIKAFAEYPIRMQGRLCKVGWLETYGPNRAVLRQGHPPHAFYFILSGTLIVTIFMTHGPKGKPATQTVAFLRRGQSFGELAILNETVRASTVITKSRCELLVISVEDFQDIFMVSGGIKSVNDPDQHAFLTSLRFLTHWPITILPQHPKHCLFHFFATGDVLVHDSNHSDWIYIVKSGSCSVLKKLKNVPENVHPSYKRKDVSMAWNLDTTLVASIINEPTKSPIRKKVKTYGDSKAAKDEKTIDGASDRRSSYSDASVKGHGSETSSVIPPVARKSQGVYLKTGEDDSIEEEQSDAEEELDENGLPNNFVDQRRTFHTDLDTSKAAHESTEADKDPTFVTIQLLLKGGVFGVTNIVFQDQPSLSLISNGAECIMIRKQFYLQHASADTLNLLRKTEFPYPTEEQLQAKLQKHMNWMAYKDHTVKSVVFQSRAHRTQQLKAVNR